MVKLEVVKTFKGKKLMVFKKRRRKSSKVKRGFRPTFTQLKVLEINK
jgi:large subunit ribosomal protein L21